LNVGIRNVISAGCGIAVAVQRTKLLRPSCPYSAYRFKLFRMKRSLAVSIALLLCLSTGFAQDWAKQKLDKSPLHGE